MQSRKADKHMLAKDFLIVNAHNQLPAFRMSKHCVADAENQ